MPKCHIASIDPGVSGTGVALWSENNWYRLVKPKHVETIYPKRNLPDWTDRMSSIMERLEILLSRFDVTNLYCEVPQFFGSSVKGQVTAETGDLVKLSAIVGAIAELCRQRRVRLVLVPVIRWKGQISKALVEARIKKRLPELEVTSHAIDAVGIGLHAKGFF